MALEEYRRKRDFSRTSEPGGDGGQAAGDAGGLWHSLPEGSRYCVQMHRSTRLHYDFRLEHAGVLLSWAIPRGPSLDPAQKRLAVQTEDHPVDYGDFEGVIPSGYGMGTVELWDAGTFAWTRESALDAETQIARGDLKFRLAGEKLAGEFALVRIANRGRPTPGGAEAQRSFLLIKKRDEAAVDGHDAADHDGSVKSGRTLDEIAAQGGGDPREEGRARRRGARATGPSPVEASAPAPPPPTWAPIPAPMLAVAVDRAFSRPGWLFEVKYDGVRAAVAVAGGRARVVGRHGRDETARYPEAEGIPARLRVESAILDCEIVVLDERGRPDFGRLQSRLNIDRPGDVRRAVERCPATFIAFDLLRVGERDLMDTDLRIRKKTLRDILEPGGPLLFADHVDTEGERLFDAVREQGLEGIVAKRGDSRYQPGKRSPDWLKIKSWHSQSCTIAGWVEGRGRRGSLGSLLLAVHGADGWVACGHVGAGVGDADIARLLARLRSIRRSTSVVNNPPATEGVTWVEPELVCEIRHAGWTRGGALRHPVFLGLRADLAPEECVREKATGADPAGAAVPAAEGGATAPAGGREPSASARPQLDAEVAEALEDLPRLRPDDVWTIGPRRLRLTNLDKPLWPDPVITKRQMIDYYVRMSPYLLPYLRGRPLSMQVFPDGITGHSFWRKDKPAHAPEWIDSWLFQGEGGSKTWIVVNEPATLAWLANAGVVDLHPWHSRTDDPLRPDWAVFDLDPSEPATFEDVRDIARLVKAALDHLGMRGVLKTSGQTGLQIYVPLRRGPDYARVRGWVLEVARAIGRVEPDRITWEWSVSRRAGRIRIDYTQNIVNKTLAAPYSLRPGPGAPVSTPLTWDELEDPHLRSDAWTMATIWDRLRDVGDLFGDVLSGDQDLPGERGVPGG